MDIFKELVAKHSLYEISAPTFHDNVPGKLSTMDLPRYDVGDTGVVKCFFGIVLDVPGPIPKNALKEAFLAKSSRVDFPEPFGLRKDPGQARIDIDVVPQTDGQFYICKIINLKGQEKVPYAKSLCYGTPYMVD